MKNFIVNLSAKYPRVESAIITFGAFFLIDLGTQFKTLITLPKEMLTWAVIWGLVVSAGRSAIKEVWVWWKTPQA